MNYLNNLDNQKLSELIAEKTIKLGFWGNIKQNLSAIWFEQSKKLSKTPFLRGEIYMCQIGENIGSEQSNRRPILIISNDRINRTAANIIALPISSKLKFNDDGKTLKFKSHYLLTKELYPFLDRDSAVLTDSIRSISKIRLEESLGKVKRVTLNEIENTLKLTLGFK